MTRCADGWTYAGQGAYHYQSESNARYALGHFVRPLTDLPLVVEKCDACPCWHHVVDRHELAQRLRRAWEDEVLTRPASGSVDYRQARIAVDVIVGATQKNTDKPCALVEELEAGG